ncbi:MAG: PEP-CTERM sorting domain-containing protein [Phycisphaeraceae bacterium]|nr:PEP-CTERM sorting domain-containing protein [Phycisphaeraceae bacterium]
MKRALAVLALAGIAGAASAQNTIHWYWTVGDTGNNDGMITMGENAVLNLYAQFSAPPGTAYAGSIFDIKGTSNWATGTLLVADGNDALGALSNEDGNKQANNDILLVDTFQLPKFFNPGIDASNPIKVYSIVWQPADYSARTVSGGTSGHLNHSVYIDDFGTSLEFAPTISGFSFQVVPAPASLALVGLGGLAAARRRRA